VQKINRAKLDRLLQLAAMNYTDLSKAAGLGYATVINLANGHTVPRAGTLRKITTALNCTPADILEEGEA